MQRVNRSNRQLTFELYRSCIAKYIYQVLLNLVDLKEIKETCNVYWSRLLVSCWLRYQQCWDHPPGCAELKTTWLPWGSEEFPNFHCSVEPTINASLQEVHEVIKSPRYTGGDFMLLYRFLRHRCVRRRRPQILVYAITFEHCADLMALHELIVA